MLRPSLLHLITLSTICVVASTDGVACPRSGKWFRHDAHRRARDRGARRSRPSCRARCVRPSLCAQPLDAAAHGQAIPAGVTPIFRARSACEIRSQQSVGSDNPTSCDDSTSCCDDLTSCDRPTTRSCDDRSWRDSEFGTQTGTPAGAGVTRSSETRAAITAG